MKVVETEVQLSVMFVSVERGAVLVTRGRPERERERERGGTVTGPSQSEPEYHGPGSSVVTV